MQSQNHGEMQNNYLNTAYRKILSESGQLKPNLNCSYTFPIDFAPNGIPINAK